jgi:predicted DNA-binding transcriptional regulator AlpA
MKTNHTDAEPARRMLDVAGVAQICGVSERHVHRLADAGLMPRPLKLGGARRWDRVTLDAWIAAGCPPISTTRNGGPKR